MLSIFLVIGLALLLAAVSYLVRGGSRPPDARAGDSSDTLDSPTIPGATDQLVIAVGPSTAEVTRAATDFRVLYYDHNLVAYPFQVHSVAPGITAISFPQHLPAELFYYLINYLSYPETGYTGSAQVRAWATLPIVTQERVVSPPEPGLVCVPPNDTDYDLVLLLTPAPAVYQVSFQNMLPILLRYPVPVTYTAPPYALAAVRQLPAITLP